MPRPPSTLGKNVNVQAVGAIRSLRRFAIEIMPHFAHTALQHTAATTA
jgi:hypothetical protein